MKIDVRLRGMAASEALRKHVVRRVHFQLSRLEGEVGSITVRLEDVNGPKGGLDKRCQVALRGPKFNPLHIEHLATEPYAAVDAAVERAARAVIRELEKARLVSRESTRQWASGDSS
jgi:ribosome-associated translation inhibitor RaiA